MSRPAAGGRARVVAVALGSAVALATAVAVVVVLAGDNASRTSTAPTATGTGTPTPSHSTTQGSLGACRGTSAPATYKHVIWIWFENQAPVVGAPTAPYFSQLADACGSATNYHGISHPSLPNYLAATGGSTFGVTDDGPPSAHPIAGQSIFGQVTASGGRWGAYAESMPANAYTSDSGTYAVRHNPALYYTSLQSSAQQADVPMGTSDSGAFATALRTDSLPSFSFVTPNLCHDMHDCPVSVGDGWLRTWMTQILASPAYARGDTAVFVTFDEDNDTSANQVSTIVVAPSVRPGTTSSQRYDHYSLLRTTEDLLGIGQHLGEAAAAASMVGAFHL